jgi:CubicO group peptidase (beta-lactamase class C family)
MSTKPIRVLALAVACAVATASLGAQGAQAVRQTSNGFAPDRLRRVDRVLQEYVDSNRIGGAVGLVFKDGRVVYEHAVGWADKEAGRRMTPDAIFRIASQSKAITSTAVLMLLEEGRINLSDPVSRWLPSFAKTTVAVRTDSITRFVPATRQITIRDLLTHTAGISYGTESSIASLYAAKGLGPAAGYGWYTADKNEPICESMDRLGTLPFSAQPGKAWVYGYNTDILGCVVERVSGVPLDEFIRTRITAPLGMTDTYFFVPPSQRDRLVAVYRSDSTGHAVRAANGPRGQGDYVDGPRKSFAGGAGIVSTARDYATFLSMILGRGRRGGTQYLSPKTIDLMTHNQVGTLHSTTGQGFGLGFETTDLLGANGQSSVGTFGWGGAYASVYKVDPAEGLVIVLMINQLPNATDIREKFPTMVYQALVEPRK